MRRRPLHRSTVEHGKLPLVVLKVGLLLLVRVARWSVRVSGLLGCVLRFTGGRFRRMRTMSRGRCGWASLPWSVLGTMVGMLCVVGVVADCEGE